MVAMRQREMPSIYNIVLGIEAIAALVLGMILLYESIHPHERGEFQPMYLFTYELNRGRTWRRRSLVAFLLSLALVIAPAAGVSVHATPQNSPETPAATTITVDTSGDLDSSSLTKTCSYTAGIYLAASDGCTLRRALLEAAARPQADRPIAIRFNLSNSDPNKDLEVSGTWTLPIDRTLPVLKTDTILNKNGQVTIDGATQPGGRTNGPKIIIDTNDFSLQVESTNNIIRNLSIKGGGVIFLKEDNNLVERTWMGLTDNGQSIHFRTPGDEKRMAGGGVFITADGNTVQDNVIAGAFARAVDIGSGVQNNTIQRNLIGTRADGSVPAVAAAAQCLRSFSFDPQNWYGGWGIAVSGSNNSILQNRIAGLHILQSANDTPPIAIEIFGANHLVQNNVIGVDSLNSGVGVCGQGIKVSGSDTRILDNMIVRSRIGFEDIVPTAILASDTSPLFGQITVRGNIVESGPGDVYAFGPGIPQVLQTFAPARITGINGTAVTGASGAGSPCPACLIDFYSDDTDGNGEALAHLGQTTADGNGQFAFTLSQPLAAGTGIRTSSTTATAGVIGSYGAGTTTRLSKLYLPMSSVSISGPLTGSTGMTQTFTITVLPIGATTPLDYAVKATDFTTQTLSTGVTTVNASYVWATPGVKTIAVTVKNDLGELSAVHSVTLAAPVGSATKDLYLPLVRR